jgi:hypothetical protein
MPSQGNASADPFVGNTADFAQDRRAAGKTPRPASKGAAALPPFDRRFQLDYPAIDDPGLRFRQSASPADSNGEAADIILVPVSQNTIALAMARGGVTDAAELVEAALKHYAARPAGT